MVDAIFIPIRSNQFVNQKKKLLGLTQVILQEAKQAIGYASRAGSFLAKIRDTAPSKAL